MNEYVVHLMTGAGKSTLLKLIYDEALVEDYIEYSGEIIKNHIHMGYLPQELSAKEKKMLCKSTQT